MLHVSSTISMVAVTDIMSETLPQQLVFLDTATMACDGDIDLSILEKFGALTQHKTSAADETAARLRGATIALTNKVVIGATEMEAAGATLKLIVVCATGTNNIDLHAARARGIAVCNVSGYSTAGVAQHVFALLLNLVTHCHRYVAEPEKWAESPIFTRMDFPIMELNGKMLGIVGYGSIGRKVAEIARAFGMTVQAMRRGNSAAIDSDIQRVPAQTFFETSDVISLHCPLTADTEKMINAESLGWMRSGGFLINTGRGGLIDEEALLEALTSGHLGGAGLDVLSAEPPPASHPLLRTKLPNLLITPHTAWSALESRRLLMEGVIGNINAFIVGESANRLV
ncbi:MAG: glycerate dehydrogenase [Verrucomicrobiales bacterium]